MFFLKDLPTDRSMRDFSMRYPNMNPSALESCAILMRTGSGLLAALEIVLGKYGLSQGRFLTLIVINRNPNVEISPSTLAEKLGVRRATVTGLLDRLEKDNLVARKVRDEDRRKIGVRITIEGQQILDQIFPDYYRHIAKLMSNLTEKERLELVSLLGKVNQGLSTILKNDLRI